jgi:sigma-B regulation protein RsbU (phosphoserine phosphatase)
MGAPKRDLSGLSKKFDDTSELGFGVCALAKSEMMARELADTLEAALKPLLALTVDAHADAGTISSGSVDAKHAVFVDGDMPAFELVQVLANIDRAANGVFLVVHEDAAVPSLWIEGQVDDVLVRPLRTLEVLSRLRQYQQMLDVQELNELNAVYQETVLSLQSDLKLAERMQKSKLPFRFPDVRGFKVTSRYLAGTRSGGDYVDLGESRDGQQVAIVLTDSSSYRLSSALLDSLPRVMSQLSIEDTRSCITTARSIRDGVLQTLNEKDQLSLFYGVLSRKDYRLRFLNLGTSRIFYAGKEMPFTELGSQGAAIVRASGVRTETEGEVWLEPEGRLALLSDGFVEAAGGVAAVLALLNKHRSQPAVDSVNELAFLVKAPLIGEDDLPSQDCTVIVFDVDSRLIRLA